MYFHKDTRITTSHTLLMTISKVQTDIGIYVSVWGRCLSVHRMSFLCFVEKVSQDLLWISFYYKKISLSGVQISLIVVNVLNIKLISQTSDLSVRKMYWAKKNVERTCKCMSFILSLWNMSCYCDTAHFTQGQQ